MQKFIVKTSWGFFEYGAAEDFSVGQRVVVDNGGLFLGVIVEIQKSDGTEIPMILRKATDNDIAKEKMLSENSRSYLATARDICKKHDNEMKVVSVQQALDGEKIVIIFVSDQRVEFKNLVKDLAGALKCRVELKQIGTRDRAALVGGLGPCGLPCCCSKALSQMPYTNIKMAKNQNLSLNSQKINGLCGKLLCCLAYENDHYAQTMDNMPKYNQKIKTPEGQGQCCGHDCLRNRVNCKINRGEGQFEIKTYSLDEVKFDKIDRTE